MKELRIPLITAVLILFVLLLISVQGLHIGKENKDYLTVSFLDVGQGDATLIESPTGTQVLIDGGKGNSILSQLESVMGFFDRTIDMVVATHPDMDHIGGLIHVLERYEVKNILMTENMSETPVSEKWEERVKEEGAHIIYARRGQVFDLGNGVQGSTTLTILFPDRNPEGLESNTASIVARLVYGESEYMLTGDSPKEIEEYLVGFGVDTLQSDVLKAGHHGSRTSTSEKFVQAVSPTYAIISAGENNSYGHPHKEVMETLLREGVEVWSTITKGRIETISDGVSIWFK